MNYLRMNSNKGLLYSDNTERSLVITGHTLAVMNKFCKMSELKNEDVENLPQEEKVILQFMIDKGLVENNGTAFKFKNFVYCKDSIDVQEIPTVLYLLITNCCNFKCPHCCWENHYRKEDELKLPELKNLVDDMVSLGIFRLSISGGEPMTRFEDLISLVEYAKDKGVTSICIATNGQLINEERLDRLAKAGVTELQFSIDHYKKEVHDAGRFKGNLEHIEYLANLINTKYAGILTVSAGLTLTNRNKDAILDIIDYTISIGIKKMKVVRFTGITELSKEEKYEITDKQVIKELSCAIVKKAQECLKDGVVVKLSSMISANAHICGANPNFKRAKNCEALRQRVCVKSDGNVAPCPLLSSYDIIVGNVKNNSLIEIFSSKEAEDFKKIYKDNDKCQNCKHYDICGGGCLASAISKEGKMNGVDEWCVVD